MLYVLSVLVALLLVMMAYLLWSKPWQRPDDLTTLHSLAELKVRLEGLKDETRQQIMLSLKEEMLTLVKEQNLQNERNRTHLGDFRQQVNEVLDKKLNDLNRNVGERLAKIDQAQLNIEKLSGQVVSLQSVLEGNQTRGQYGEFQLQMILRQVFGDGPGLYAEQYVLKSAAAADKTIRPDAVVFLPEPNHMICIDSKFPFADYKRIFESGTAEAEQDTLKKSFRAAVKGHITEIKNKYIIEGRTAPQALMFVPNDGIFAFIHSELYDLVTYAQSVNVIITSPGTLQPILSTVNLIRLHKERSENLQEITKQLSGLASDFRFLNNDWKSLTTNLDKTVKSRNNLQDRMDRLNNRFDRIIQNQTSNSADLTETASGSLHQNSEQAFQLE